MMFRGRSWGWLCPLLLLAALLVLWEAAVRLAGIPRYILPAPSGIGRELWVKAGLLAGHSLVTLGEIALGLVIGLAGGLGLGVLVFVSRTLERTVMPLVVASQAVPVFAAAPLLVLWFGYGPGSKAAMAAIIVFFPIVVNTLEGLKSTDPDLVALLEILEADRRQIFFKVRVPQALPYVLAGVRVGAAVSVIGAVIGEWVGAREGLGYLMMQANAQLRTELLFAAIVCLSVMGTGLYWAVGALERILTPWKKRADINKGVKSC
jgi:ABC-type nitrate/sulfonate/bicarbonate transport system permease component